jgi:hypothetical protein
MLAVIVTTFARRFKRDWRFRCCRCRSAKKAIAAIVNVERVIALVHITLSLSCGEQKRHNPIARSAEK